MNVASKYQGCVLIAVGVALLVAFCGCAATPTAIKPTTSSRTVSPEKAINSQTQADQVMKDCMAESGYVENPGGGYSVPKEQADKLNQDLSSCATRVDAATAPWDDADWKKVFSENVDSANCLASHGYSVPARPSLQAFRDTYGKAGMWDPYANVPSNKLQSAIDNECPQPEPVW